MVGVVMLKYFIGLHFELTLLCKMQFHQLSFVFGSFNVTSQGLDFLTYSKGGAGTFEVLVVAVWNAVCSRKPGGR